MPTEDKSHIINDGAIGLQYNSIPLDNTLGYNPQHLYFTSDEDIKEGLARFERAVAAVVNAE